MIPEGKTKHRLRNGEYPSLNIHWHRPTEADGCSGPDMWVGEGWVWKDGNTRIEQRFVIQVGQGWPLGSIHWSINPCAYGANDFGGFPGTGITERDWFWAGEMLTRFVKHCDWAFKTDALRDEFKGSYAGEAVKGAGGDGG